MFRQQRTELQGAISTDLNKLVDTLQTALHIVDELDLKLAGVYVQQALSLVENFIDSEQSQLP